MPTQTDVPLLSQTPGTWQRLQPPIVGPAGSAVEALNEQTQTSGLNLWPVSRNVHEVFELDLSVLPSSALITGVTIRFQHRRRSSGGIRVWSAALTPDQQLVDGVRENAVYDRWNDANIVEHQKRSTLANGARWSEYSRVAVQVQHEGSNNNGTAEHLLYWVTADIDYDVIGPLVYITAPEGDVNSAQTVDWSYTAQVPQFKYQVVITDAPAGPQPSDAVGWWDSDDYVAGAASWTDKNAALLATVTGAPSKNANGIQITPSGEFIELPAAANPQVGPNEVASVLIVYTAPNSPSTFRAIFSTRSSPSPGTTGGFYLVNTADPELDMTFIAQNGGGGFVQTQSQINLEGLVAAVFELNEVRLHASWIGDPGAGSVTGRTASDNLEAPGQLEIGRHQFDNGGLWVGDMEVRHVLVYNVPLSTAELADIHNALGGTSATEGPTGNRVFDTGIQIGNTVRSVEIGSPLAPGSYRAFVKVWSLAGSGLEVESDWFSSAFAVLVPAVPLDDPVSVVPTFNTATGATDVVVTPPVGVVGDTILLERSDGGLEFTKVASFSSNASVPVTYNDTTAPFHTSIVYRARFTSSLSDPPSGYTNSVAYEVQNDKWWLMDPEDLSLTINPVPVSYNLEEARTAAVARSKGGATAATSGGLGHDFELDLWIKTEADRLAFEAIFDSGRPLRIVDILGREFMVAPVGPIGKQIQRSMPNNAMSTGLRDFHRYRLSLVEVSS